LDHQFDERSLPVEVPLAGQDRNGKICFAYLANSFTSLVLPRYEHLVYQWVGPLLYAELLFLLWLLIKGANPKPLASPAIVGG
jgi:hypothetical protein